MEVVEAAHSYGGVVFHDVINVKHARKAAENGVDGLILVCAGAGGHAGTLSPFALLREVNRQLGTSFLIVTHDPRLAHRCDRIIELVDGRIVSDRPTEVAAGRSPVEGSAEETE